MSHNEKLNSNKGIIIGFYVYLILLGIDSIFSIMSSFTMFVIGIVISFASGFLLNLKDKKTKK